MGDIYGRFMARNVTLPKLPGKGGVCTPVVEFRDHLPYCGGCGSQRDGDSIDGKPGSNLLMDLLGEEAGCPARAAMGVNAKPGKIAVEIEALVEYR